MVRAFLSTIVIFLGWIAPHQWVMARGQGRGSLRFEAVSHDFGEVYRGQQLTQRFGFTNIGDGPVTIQGVHTACGCTAVEVDKGREYQPGERGMVEVRLDTTDFAGTMVKSVTILTNQKLEPDRLITVKARVRSEFEVSPPLLDFGSVYAREGGTQVVKIRPLGSAKVGIQDVQFNPKTLDVTVTTEGDQNTLTAKLKPGLSPGFVKESVALKTSARHLRELVIPVRAFVKGDVEFLPSYLEFGVVPKAETVKRELTLKGYQAFAIKKTRLEMIVNGKRVDDPSLLVKTAPAKSGEDKEQTLAVEIVNAGQVEGSVHGKLTLETTASEAPDLVVDFYAFFR